MIDWRKRKWLDIVLLLIIALTVFTLAQLGNWQLRRLEWKTALIAAVEARAFAPPVDAPRAGQWPGVAADSHAYMRVQADGILLHDHELLVKALTDLGAGFWVMTPLKRENGEIIWVNRGFVPSGKRERTSRTENKQGLVRITGLLRVTEPGGTLLQDNDPANGRWYSRDLRAFSANQKLPEPAPYFIDAERSGPAGAWPRGGLTKLTFRNNHLQYALTWYAMAMLLIAGTVYVVFFARHTPD